MKIIGINSSPRKSESNTRRLVLSALKGASAEGVKTEFVDLCELDINYCIGCGICYQTGRCIHEDDFEEIFEKIMDADGIVLGSPNYINSVTAQMKTFLDRTADAIHCRKWEGKYGISVSTAGGSAAEDVAEYLNSAIRVLGAYTVGLVGVDIMGDEDRLTAAEREAEKLGAELAKAIEERVTYPDQQEYQTEMKERMRGLIIANRENFSHEYDYWDERGWL